jgi:ribosomal protein S18 acetylase RimI-like enzyme
LRLQLEGQDPPFECLLAEEEDKPAGFALFYSTYSTFTGAQGMYLVDLYVSPSFRRSGVGRLMFAKLLDIARARKYARIDWEVLKGNSQAEDFYRSLQARRLDQWTCWRLEPGRLKAEETAFVTGPCSIAQCSS